VQNQLVLDVGLGEIDGSCLVGDRMGEPVRGPLRHLRRERRQRADPCRLIGADSSGEKRHLRLTTSYVEPNPTGVPQAIEFQVAETNTTANHIRHVATAWTTDHGVGGTSCIFTGQALTTGP
jgi:hypothetical protein